MAKKASRPGSVEEWVAFLRQGKLTRRQVMLGLTALGVTGTGAAAVLAATHHVQQGTPAQIQQHLQRHDQHISRQMQGELEPMMRDYAEQAVVEDPLFAVPFVGRAAIAARYAAEVASVPDRTLEITNRVVAGGQLIVEWVARGTHTASFLGVGGTGGTYRISGVTVVTRGADGRIERESHYYDAADLRRQIEA
jgi:steroid delta-isomerase-like uncharacterized protein